MLNDVAGNRGDDQNDKWNGDCSGHLAPDFLKQPWQGWTVHADIVRIGDNAAHRGGEMPAHRAGERQKHKCGTGNDKPGIHFLAFDDVAAFKRLFESFLGWFFCFIEFAGFFRHANSSSDAWSKVGKNAVEIVE